MRPCRRATESIGQLSAVLLNLSFRTTGKALEKTGGTRSRGKATGGQPQSPFFAYDAYLAILQRGRGPL